MSLEVRFAFVFLFVCSALTAIAVITDAHLPGRIQDLPTSERNVVKQLRSMGYRVTDTGFI